MVFNSLIIASAAQISADAWQQIARIHVEDRVSSQQLLDLLCCFPLQQLGYFLRWIWTLLCLPPPDSYYYSDDDSSDDEDEYFQRHPPHLRLDLASSSSSSVDLDDFHYNSHSD